MLKFRFLTFLAFIGLKSIVTYSQNQKERELYLSIDKELSAGNMPINNGKFHINADIPFENEHRYFLENKTYTGEIKFGNQVYYNSSIKYDTYKDDLVLHPENQSEKLFIILDKSKVDYFIIQNRKFVKQRLSKDAPLEYVEESVNAQGFVFYIKHKKSDKELIQENSVLVSYISDTDYYVKIGNSLTEVKSKNSIQKLFPQLKSEINDFYKYNKTLEKENNVKFMENLMLTIKKSNNN